MSALKEEAKEQARQLTQWLNGGADIQSFLEQMDCEHRTLQQAFTRLCVFWLVHLSELPEGWYDLRNEASVKLGREFVERVAPEKRLLPFI